MIHYHIYMRFKRNVWHIHRSHTPQLIEAVRFGDQLAYEELLRRGLMPVRKFCAIMGSPHDAEDLTQETFLRAIKCNFITDKEMNVEAFLINIARWVCASYVRERQKARELFTHMHQNNDIATDTYNDLSIESIDLLNTLDTPYKESFILSQILGFSYEDISSITEAPIGTVRSRISRARKKLKESSYQLEVS